MDLTRISKQIAAELTDHLDWGRELRAAGLHKQAACYDLFLDGRMPYGVMMRHFERQRSAAFRSHAGFLDKLKELPGEVKSVVQEQAGKWKARLDKAVQESLPELAKLKGIEDEHGIEAKKSLWQGVLDKFAQNVMDDYKESLAAVKDDPTAVQEFVDKLFDGAMAKAKQSLAKTLPAFIVAGLLGGPAAIGAMFFRKALFRAAKAAIKAGDAILTRTLGDAYTEKKEQVKEKAKGKTREIVMGVIRKVFKSQKEAGERIGAGVGAMALALKAGKEAKDALRAMHGYVEKRYGKTTADAMANILKALVIAGLVRSAAAAVSGVAEWFADDPEMAEMAASIRAGGEAVSGDAEAAEMLGAESVGKTEFGKGEIERLLGTNVVKELPNGEFVAHLGGQDFVKLDASDLEKMEKLHEKWAPRLESESPQVRLKAQQGLRMQVKNLLLTEGERVDPEVVSGLGEQDQDPFTKRERQDRAIARLTKERAMELGVSEDRYDEAVGNVKDLDEARAEGIPEHAKSAMEREQKIRELNQLAKEIKEHKGGGLAELKEKYNALRDDIANWEENRPDTYSKPGLVG